MLRSFSRGRRPAAVVLLASTALLGIGSAATAAAASANDLTGACTDPDGVTVVVDFTDMGGAVEVGCATAPETGTAALAAAGFTDVRDASGMICAIDSVPDPCPETFEGSYWSYWYALADDGWASYLEGSDTAAPEPGQIEGWRYSDGSAGPTVTPAEVRAAAAASGASTETPADAAADATAAASGAGLAPDGTEPWVVVVIGLAVVGAVAATGIGLARRTSGRGTAHGPGGQD